MTILIMSWNCSFNHDCSNLLTVTPGLSLYMLMLLHYVEITLFTTVNYWLIHSSLISCTLIPHTVSYMISEQKTDRVATTQRFPRFDCVALAVMSSKSCRCFLNFILFRLFTSPAGHSAQRNGRVRQDRANRTVVTDQADTRSSQCENSRIIYCKF